MYGLFTYMKGEKWPHSMGNGLVNIPYMDPMGLDLTAQLHTVTYTSQLLFLPNVPFTDTELGKPRKQSWKIHPTFPDLQSVLQVPNQRRFLFDREIIQPELHSHVWVGFREPGKQCLKDTFVLKVVTFWKTNILTPKNGSLEDDVPLKELDFLVRSMLVITGV